jgi:long-chain acyl-CoA synthetase
MSPKLCNVEVTHLSHTPKGETTVRRNASSSLALTETPHSAVRTIHDLVQFNARRWGDTRCFGTRHVIKTHTEKQPDVAGSAERTQVFWELGPYEYRTYQQVAQEGIDVGFGLRKLGLAKGDKLAIYAETSYIPLSPF